MLSGSELLIVSALGFVIGAIGGLGSELLDRFTGRSLEAYCRLRGNRERFGEVLDRWEDAINGATYLRILGNVIFLIAGSAGLTALEGGPPPVANLLAWLVVAAAAVMLTHLWFPTAITRFISAPLLYHTWPLWRTLAIAMRPLEVPGRLLASLTRRLTGHTGEEDDEEEALEDEIRTIVAAGTREGLLAEGVREMIQGVMDLHEDTVDHIMTPRSEVDALEVDTPWPEVLASVAESRRTRLPVYERTLDRIVGILYVKDLLPEMADGRPPSKTLRELLRRRWLIPETKKVDELLRDFLHSRTHMAIVIDEFHQVAGVVTIEDALEEIVGEIIDESDEEEQVDIRVIDEKIAEAAGRVMIDELNEELGWDLPESDDYDTIAGYVLHHTGELPAEGDVLDIGPLQVHVVRASNRQIERVRLTWQSDRTREAG